MKRNLFYVNKLSKSAFAKCKGYVDGPLTCLSGMEEVRQHRVVPPRRVQQLVEEELRHVSCVLLLHQVKAHNFPWELLHQGDGLVDAVFYRGLARASGDVKKWKGMSV